MRKIATRIKTRTDRGEEHVFVYAEIKEFLPSYCPDLVPVVLEEHGDVGKVRSSPLFAPYSMSAAHRRCHAGAKAGR